jgi:hypothetical protein
MTDFASHMLSHPFDVANPFVWLTKAEVVRLIERHDQADLIERSFSCTHPRKTGQRAHCGKCAQCLHRRLGILAAGLGKWDPPKGYDVELFADERKVGEPRSMALSLVSNAQDYPHLSPRGFLSRYAGEILQAVRAFPEETVESFVQRSYELHRRYGNEVDQVIADAIRQYAAEIRDHTLPPHCLLRAVTMDPRQEGDRRSLEDAFTPKSTEPDQDTSDFRDFKRTSRIQLALDADRSQIVIDGLGDVGTSAQFELVATLVEQHRADLRAELKSENYAFLRTDSLLEKLGIESETALRKRVSDFRLRVFDLALKKWGIPLNLNAVIEGRSREGYRLNPDVRVIATSELG